MLEIHEKRDPALRLPRQAEHYSQIVGHFLAVKNSRGNRASQSKRTFSDFKNITMNSSASLQRLRVTTEMSSGCETSARRA